MNDQPIQLDETAILDALGIDKGMLAGISEEGVTITSLGVSRLAVTITLVGHVDASVLTAMLRRKPRTEGSES